MFSRKQCIPCSALSHKSYKIHSRFILPWIERCKGIRILINFCLWNPKFVKFELGNRNPRLWNYRSRNSESEIQVPVTKHPESSKWNPESKGWDCLGFPYMGRIGTSAHGFIKLPPQTRGCSVAITPVSVLG